MDDLRNSVARVSGVDEFSGTAFLVDVGQDNQLWMTCHHVIRELPALRLTCHTRDADVPFDCDYRADLSAPQLDIAVLESKLTEDEVAALKLQPLPMGAPPVDFDDAPVFGCGFSSNEQVPRGIIFRGRYSTYQYMAIPNDDHETRAAIVECGRPWNIPFEERRRIDFYEFRDEGARVERGFSGSPVCTEIAGSAVCIGMLSTRRVASNNVPTHGFIIPYEQIKAASPRALPFHAYADYVVVVLAATRPEFEEISPQLDIDDLKRRSAHYDRMSREEWRPFALNDPTVKALVAEAAGTSRWCQLSSDYLDRADPGFDEYLRHRGAGALVFVIDRNSLAAPSLRRFLELARDYNRDACYVFPMCEEMLLAHKTVERQLQNDFGAELWGQWHRHRVRLSWHCEDFSSHFEFLLTRAWELFIAENHTRPRRRRAGAGRAGAAPYMGWSSG